jgi:uncharacterized protein YegL
LRYAIPLAAALFLTAAACPTRAGDEYHQDNVVVVLDASGSMGNTMSGTRMTKMEAAQQGLLAVIELLPENAKVGILVFSSKQPQFRDWVYPLGPLHPEEIKRAILGPEPGGGTPLGDYIKRGADRLLEECSKQFGYGSFRPLVVTDGEAGDAALVDRYAPDVLARGITLDAIGVDMKKDHTLAKLAHSYRRADDPASLKKAVSEVFAEIGSSQGDAAGGADDFALLEPLAPDLALAMIGALAHSGNHPIGSSPPPPEGETASSAPPPATSRNSPPAGRPKAPARSSGGGAAKDNTTDTWLLVGAVLVALLFFGSGGSKKTSKGRA